MGTAEIMIKVTASGSKSEGFDDTKSSTNDVSIAYAGVLNLALIIILVLLLLAYLRKKPPNESDELVVMDYTKPTADMQSDISHQPMPPLNRPVPIGMPMQPGVSVSEVVDEPPPEKIMAKRQAMPGSKVDELPSRKEMPPMLPAAIDEKDTEMEPEAEAEMQ